MVASIRKVAMLHARRFLKRRGGRVLRFWDNEVLLEVEAVVEAIWHFAYGRTLTPTPLPGGEGL